MKHKWFMDIWKLLFYVYVYLEGPSYLREENGWYEKMKFIALLSS